MHRVKVKSAASQEASSRGIVLAVEPHVLDWHRALADSPLGQPPGRRRRLDGQHHLHLGRIVRDVEPRPEPDLDHPPRQPVDRLRPPAVHPGGTAHQLDHAGHDVLPVHTHRPDATAWLADGEEESAHGHSRECSGHGCQPGIGRAIALELANRGFDTVATMRDTAAGAGMEAETEGRLSIRRLDVTDPSTFDVPNDLRVLVNNAGIDTDYLPVEFANIDDWRRMFETNVFGVVALTAAAIPLLRVNQPSVVCTITSSSIIAAVPFYSAYRASKAAVSAFCDSLRVEVAPFGIRAVEILPGPVDTDMFRLSTGEQDAGRFVDYRALAAVAATLRREHADPRVVEPAQAAAAVVDAILDDSGPMRYGCDPVSLELLGLWRQCDDETVFTLTGRSLLDQVPRVPGPRHPGRRGRLTPPGVTPASASRGSSAKSSCFASSSSRR